MNFPPKLCGWIKECVFSPSFSILINGSPAGFFHGSRGLRQGCPLSPLLFVIAMELLSIAMDLATVSGNIQPMKHTATHPPSHILFADDVLIFCKANHNTFEGIKRMFGVLQSVSGLNVNFEKSKVYMSKGVKDKTQLASVLGIPKGSLPFKYLGLPLSSSYPKAIHYQPLMDACRKRLHGWSGKVLSVAGRAQLITSVLQNTAMYWLQTYRFPASIIRQLESMFSNFFWGYKLHPEPWHQICKPKREGGMNIRSIKEINIAAGIKLLWTLSNSNCLWSDFTRNKYKFDNILHQTATVFHSGTWKFLIRSRDAAIGSVLISINGEPSWTITAPKLHQFWAATRTRSPPSAVHSAIWFPNNCPKMSLCTSRAVKGTLLTKDLLIHRTIGVDPLCVLCKQENESPAHLFFNCSYSAYIWSVCRLKLGLVQNPLYNLEEEIIYLKQKFTKSSGVRMLARLAVPTVVWHLWRERNNRIFQGREKTRAELIQEILSTTRILCTDDPKGGRGKLIMDNWL